MNPYDKSDPMLSGGHRDLVRFVGHPGVTAVDNLMLGNSAMHSHTVATYSSASSVTP